MTDEETDGYDGTSERPTRSHRSSLRQARNRDPADAPRATLPLERLAACRHRIERRIHDTDAMADEVMRRIVMAGDLR